MKYSKLLDKYDREFWEAAIDRWIFDELDRHLLKRRYLDGIRLEPLAEEVHLSNDGLKRRLYRASEKLFKKLK